jgi:hypothetical protein
VSHAGAPPVHAQRRGQRSSRSCASPRPALLVSARGAERPHTPCFKRWSWSLRRWRRSTSSRWRQRKRRTREA